MAGLRLRICTSTFGRNIHKPLWRRPGHSRSVSSFYVLAPEVPPDTEQTNALLRLNEHPSFEEIDANKCVSGCAKRAIEFEVAVTSLMDSLRKNRDGMLFKQLWQPIEKCLAPLNHCLKTTKQMAAIHPSFQDALNRCLPQVENAKNIRWVNQDLYKALKHMKATQASLSEQERRLIHIYLLRSRLSGVEVKDREAYSSILFKLAEYKKDFRSKVDQSGRMFSQVVEDFDVVAELPRKQLMQLSLNQSDRTRGPWRLTLKNYQLVMQHCGDRMTRWNFWRAYNNRASNLHPQKHLSNHSTIEEIRNLRRDMAKYLKYNTYVDMSLASKMAGGVDEVVEFIDSLKQRFQPVSDNEFVRLQEFAMSEGFGDKLESWDVPYWRNRQLNHLYPLDMDTLTEYFPLNNVIKYLFKMYKALFHMRFQDCTSEARVWSEDVLFYKIFDTKSGEHMSSLYIELYAPAGSQDKPPCIDVGRERCELLGVMPYSYLQLNLTPPNNNNNPSHQPLVSFQQLQHIFYQFGHSLQQLGTSSPHSETSGQNSIELDSLETIPILSRMILSTRQTLRFMSCHHQHQTPLPDEVIDTIMKRRHHMQSYDTMHNLFLSSYDLELHTSKEHWHSLMEKVWSDFMPHKQGDADNFPCSFTPIFSQSHPAAYYSYKWSEMLACEIFKTFKQANQNGKEEMMKVGTRFRHTYLSLGGSIGAAEVFRRFQGADASAEALVEYYLRE